MYSPQTFFGQAVCRLKCFVYRIRVSVPKYLKLFQPNAAVAGLSYLNIMDDLGVEKTLTPKTRVWIQKGIVFWVVPDNFFQVRSSFRVSENRYIFILHFFEAVCRFYSIFLKHF